MMTKLSFNVLGQHVADIPRLLNRLEKRQPAWTLVLDNLDLARQIKARVPACNVIFRTWPDDGLHTSRDAEAWVLEKKAQMQGLDAFAYGGNEPGWSAFALRQTASALKLSAQRVQAFAMPSPLAFIQEFFLWVFWRLFMRVESQAVKSSVQWAIDVIQAAKKHGLKVVVLNLSAGTPEPNDWKTPKAQTLLRLLNENRNMAVLGLHEYCAGVVTSGMGGWPQAIRAEDWPTSIEGRDCYHLGRYRFLLKACAELGIPVPRIVVTEFGFDRMSDIEQWLDMLVRTPPHQTIRGWQTLINQWREWWKTWTPQYALFRAYSYAGPVFYNHPAVEAYLVFQYGARSADWGPFDVEAADEFHTLFEDEPGEEPEPMPVPAGNTYQLVKLTGANFVNLRAEPKAKADDKGDVLTGDVLYIYPDAPVPADNYIWAKVDQYRNNAKLVSGVWLAVTLAAIGLTVTSAPTLPEEPSPVEQATADTLKLIDHLTLALNVVAQSMAAELGQAVVELNRIRETLKK